ncbi:arogenate dehydrogenase 2, chloroplastic-like [Aristolochia californica]|uniref:arogenate dehydrogenase 2, chloroplastic-like n=1 Tax=Aristolochia californica TaxID=171875 RepID=UPI0035DB870B
MSSSNKDSCHHHETLKIGIVGFGPFAQFLAKTMIRQGHSLTATSRSDYSDLCNQMGIKFFREMTQFCEAENDVVLLCTSIISSLQVVQSNPFNLLTRRALFVDVLSVKEYPRDLLLNLLPDDCDLVCTHPMFGPESGKNGWKGLPMVFERVRVRDQNLCSTFLGIFEREGCRMVEMTCQEHDKLAAKTQFVTHTIGRMLSEMEIEPTPMDTKGFQMLLQLRETMCQHSFDLYLGLFKHNRFAIEELNNMERALQTVKKKLMEGMDKK